jgi:hypothetical protein
MLISLTAFFGWYSEHDQIAIYRKTLAENIYACMEMSGMSYSEVAAMPVKKLFDYLKWKSDLEEEKRKMMKEEVKKLK